MTKKLSLDDLEELINKIPSDNIDNDINYLNDYLSIAGPSHFRDAFENFQKIDMAKCDSKLLEELISSLIYSAQTPNQSVELFMYLNGKTDQELLIKRFTRSEYIGDAILPILTSKSFSDEDSFRKLCYNLINAIVIFDEIPYYLRSLRQSIFQFAFIRKELRLCLDILKSVNLARSSSDFFEFSSYATSLIQLVVDDESVARSLFEYMLNCSTFYYNEPGIAYETWFITCLTSFVPLLYGKTVHPAVLDYVKYFLSLTDSNGNNDQYIVNNSGDSNYLKKGKNLNVKHLKQIISKFEDSSRPIYNSELPLNAAPSLLRPYYLFKLWNVNIYTIDKNADKNIQPEQIYNALLNLYKKCPGPESSNTVNRPYLAQKIYELLSQFSLDTSLPFYFLLAQRGYEKEFHDAVNDVFEHKKGSIEKVLLIFERAARTYPRLLKPHFNSLSKLKIEQCAAICPLLVKSDFLSFTSLWKFIKNLPFNLIKSIIREGIVQIQRRSRSFENAKFIVNVLRQFFGKPSSKKPAINWSAVAEEFPDDISISSTILLNESIVNEEKDNKNDNNSYLLSWKEQFIRYISKSPATIHRVAALPYLLLCSLDNSIQIEKVKWAVSKLPAYQNNAESILEGYAIFEISKHIISQSVSSEQSIKDLHSLFGYEKGKVVSYTSSFAIAAMVLKFGDIESLNALTKSIDSDHLFISKSAKLAINFLQLNNFIFDEKYDDVLKKVNDPLVNEIFGLLSPIGSNLNSKPNNLDANLDKDEKLFIKMLKQAHSMNVDSIIKILQKNQFDSFHELRNHLIFLSVSCFLLLPARSISQSSTDKCVSLLNSPSSTSKQKNFALLALSQTPSFPDNLPLEQLSDDSFLHRSLLMVASKTKNADLISSVLSKSNDFTILDVIKPLLPFLDQKIISRFVEKTALDTDVQILFDSLDLFTNPNIIFIVFTDIRCRPIIDTIRTNRFQKLRTSISKLGPQEQMEKITFTPFDDFALLSMHVLEYPISRICKGLISEKSMVTLPSVFLVLMNKRQEMFQFADSMFAYIQDLEANEIVKALKFIVVFFLIGSSKEPFETIRLHLESNPSDLTEDLVHSLLPSLFARFISKIDHYEILLKANKDKKCFYLDEAVQALRLKQLS